MVKLYGHPGVEIGKHVATTVNTGTRP
jgi:hypothetical protein